jgi:hypothetical protein
MRVAVPFAGFPDETNWHANKLAWRASGQQRMETLTTHPSIDQSSTPGCSFHGWIRDGVVTW